MKAKHLPSHREDLQALREIQDQPGVKAFLDSMDRMALMGSRFSKGLERRQVGSARSGTRTSMSRPTSSTTRRELRRGRSRGD